MDRQRLINAIVEAMVQPEIKICYEKNKPIWRWITTSQDIPKEGIDSFFVDIVNLYQSCKSYTTAIKQQQRNDLAIYDFKDSSLEFIKNTVTNEHFIHLYGPLLRRETMSIYDEAIKAKGIVGEAKIFIQQTVKNEYFIDLFMFIFKREDNTVLKEIPEDDLVAIGNGSADLIGNINTKMNKQDSN